MSDIDFGTLTLDLELAYDNGLIDLETWRLGFWRANEAGLPGDMDRSEASTTEPSSGASEHTREY